MAVIVTQTAWFKEWLRGFIVRQAEDYVNGRLSIGRLDGNLFFGVEMEDVDITMNGKKVVDIKDVGLDYNSFTFLLGHVVLDDIRINQPVFRIERTPEGWNITELIKARTPNPNEPKNRVSKVRQKTRAMPRSRATSSRRDTILCPIFRPRQAGSVAAMMGHVMGVRDPNLIAAYCRLGRAVQLTNIARDVTDDATAGRIYLPLDWLRERIAGIVEEGQEQGQFAPSLDGEAIAATVVATVQGGYVLARAAGSPGAFDAGVRGLLSLLAPQQR